ncbi:MAG: hypothetical protein JWQ99_3350 [Blastococcus sp.]|nr:hypothetical protein [Blastococcus sp.]
MSTGRMEAFSDGVPAIVITVTVLELPVPHGTTCRVTGLILWADLHLLVWLSLVPFTTAWMGENHFAATPAAAYGLVLLAYFALERAIIRDQGRDARLARAVGRDWKGKLSPVAYGTAIGLSFVDQWLAVAIYVVMALRWLVPDRRVEGTMAARIAEG